MDFEGLTKPEIDELIKGLTMYAATKVRKRRWRGSFATEAPKQGYDYVVDALVALRTGTRSRNKEEYPKLRDQLEAVIDSLVNNDLTRASNARERRADDHPAEMANAHVLGRPDETAAELETARKVKAVLEGLVLTASDTDGGQLIEAFDLFEQYGEYEPAELVARLGLNEQEANNLRKRFARVLRKATTQVAGGVDVET